MFWYDLLRNVHEKIFLGIDTKSSEDVFSILYVAFKTDKLFNDQTVMVFEKIITAKPASGTLR